MEDNQEEEKPKPIVNTENVKKESKTGIPEEICILLVETETVLLFEMPSMTVEKGTEEGDAAEKDNEIYLYLTKGMGKNRKMKTSESQTNDCILKTRSTFMPEVLKTSSYAFASAWDLHDSFKTVDEEVEEGSETKSVITSKYIKRKPKRVKKVEQPLSIREINLINSTIVMERMLANNVYNEQQEFFKNIAEEVKDSKSYFLYLWSFVCAETMKRTVTSMCLNPKNNDILAVGYGKFYYVEKTNGIVAVWNMKNPIQPELILNFEHPVTSIQFSECDPNLLAVGYYNGKITILDISISNGRIIAETGKDTYPSYEPIWNIAWHKLEDKESVISAGQDGRISRFSLTESLEFIYQELIRLHRVDGSIRGKFEVKKLTIHDVPVSRYAICLFLCHHPTLEDIYFVGTMDGCIYKCSVNCPDHYINVFSAHDGPVNAMKFSNFQKTVFLTCGADWLVKIWMENLVEPLMILDNSLRPIKSVIFCPTHSTIIAAISTERLYLWDLKIENKMLLEEKVLGSNDSTLTNLNFTSDGKNIMIGASNGDIRVYNLINISEPDEDEENVLDSTLDRILIIKPDLAKKVDRIRKNKDVF